MNKIVVYTCIFGNYDCLKPVVNPSSSIDYICFTDNPNLESDGVWKIRQFVSDIYTENLSPIKKQRMIKILPHIYLKEYDISLWVDGNIQITGNLIFEFFNNLDDEKIMYVNRHLARDCIYREEVEVIRLKKDKPENTNKQIARYRAEGFPEHFGLAETNIIVRRHNDFRCKKLMFDWAKEIVNGSYRDQLSFDYCRWKNGMSDYIGWLECNKYYTTSYDVFRIYHHGQKMRPIFILNKQNKFKIVPNKTEQEQKPQTEAIDNKEDKKVEDNKENKIAEDNAKEKLKDEVEKIKEENNNISNSLKEKLKVIEALKQKLEIANDKNTKLESINTVNAEEIKELNSSISIYEAKINTLNATLEGFKKLVENHKTQDDSTKKIIQNLENAKKELKDKLESERLKCLPPISIIITTHNRTAVAQYTLKSLIKNIKYSGKLFWIICDDRSIDGHVQTLEAVLKDNNIVEYEIRKTNNKRYGLGASLNNGLTLSFTLGPIVLTTEDDWLLVKELNLDKYVSTLINNENVAGIRLATTSAGNSLEKSQYDEYWKFKKDSVKQYIFNNQVMLRHKRIYDLIGYNKENCSADEQEQDIVRRFNNKTNFGKDMQVLYPKLLDKNPSLYGKNNYFHHIGKSTLDKDRYIDKKYINLNDDKLDDSLRKDTLQKYKIIEVTSNEITVGMATVPWRRDMVFTTANIMLPQCTRLCISLNQYGEIPQELLQLQKIYGNKLILKLSGEGKELEDFGCQNKMFWVGKYDGYYLSIDDDIYYPINYVKELIDGINRYNKNVFCSFHGAIYNLKNKKIDTSNRYKEMFWFDKEVKNDVFVNRIGMGLGGFVPSKLGVTWEKDFSHIKNFGDDEDVIHISNEKGIKLVCLAHKANWLQQNRQHTKDRRALSGSSITREVLHSRTDNIIFTNLDNE